MKKALRLVEDQDVVKIIKFIGNTIVNKMVHWHINLMKDK